MSGALLFIGADAREFSGLLSHWESVSPLHLSVHWARSGRWRGREVFAIANGAGCDRAFAAALMAPKVSAIFNIGFCGALDESLKIGDIVVVTQIRAGDNSWPTSIPDGPPAARGILLSTDRIAQTAAEKHTLRAATGACIVEMEAAGAARAAEDRGVPLYCVRAVSDLATEDFQNDFNAALLPDGRFSTFRLLTQLKLGELVDLQKRTALASKKLGDFLAASSF